MQLSTNHIIVSDLDTARKDLLAWLVSPPKYGFIENTKRGKNCVTLFFFYFNLIYLFLAQK